MPLRGLNTLNLLLALDLIYPVSFLAFLSMRLNLDKFIQGYERVLLISGH